jgi:hypothetical protein
MNTERPLVFVLSLMPLNVPYSPKFGFEDGRYCISQDRLYCGARANRTALKAMNGLQRLE